MNQQENEEHIPIVSQEYQLPTNLDNFTQPVYFKCDSCEFQGVSILQHKPGNHTWLCCVTLCIFGGALAFLPFYLKDCQDVQHVCQRCSQPKGFTKFKAFG